MPTDKYGDLLRFFDSGDDCRILEQRGQPDTGQPVLNSPGQGEGAQRPGHDEDRLTRGHLVQGSLGAAAYLRDRFFTLEPVLVPCDAEH